MPGENAAAVRRLFELSRELGYVSVLRTMQAEGWPAPTAAGWTKSTIETLLVNKRYTGQAVFGGVSLRFDPIVSQELFDQVQAARSLRNRESAPKGELLLWTGHLRCVHCGGAVGRHRISARGYTYIYYRCWRASTVPPQPKCDNGRNWPIADADEQWWAFLLDTLADPARLPDLLPPVVQPARLPPPARVSELEDAIGRAWQPFAAGKVSAEVAERLAAPYVAELERLKQEYTPAPLPSTPDYAELSAGLLQAARTALTFEDRRSLLDALDVRLYIGPEGVERVSLQLM